MNSFFDLPDVPELCHRLHREAQARVVFILGEEGEIVGFSGKPGELPDAVVDAVADATAETLKRIARGGGGGDGAGSGDADDHLAEAEAMHICAAPVGAKAVLAVVFEDAANLGLVRLRMKRARELILRTLEGA